MFKKILLGAILTANACSLYSVDASTQTNFDPPSIFMEDVRYICNQCTKLFKTVGRTAQFLYKKRNAQPVRIGGHTLKILGGLWIALRTVNFLHDVSIQSFYHRRQADTNAQPSVSSDVLYPKTSFRNQTGKGFRLERIPRPSYVTAFAIATYLVYDGCSGIYNELKN